MNTTMPVSSPPATNAKNPSTKGESRRSSKPKGRSAKQSGPENAASPRSRNKDRDLSSGKSAAAKDAVLRTKDSQLRKSSPTVTTPQSNDPEDDGSKFSGSTFHLSPNAASLPRPPFKGKSGNSPPLQGGSVSNTSIGLAAAAPCAPPPPPMMFRPPPQYGVPYGAYPGYPSGAYPPVLHTPMGMVPAAGGPAYGGTYGASPMGPIVGFPPMMMNLPPQGNVPH